MKSSAAKQIEELVQLDAMTEGGYFQNFIRGLVIIIAVLLALGFYTKLPPYFIVAAFLGFVAYATRKSTPHLKNATRAVTEGQKKAGLVKVEGIYDSDSGYSATVIDPTLGTWHLTFVAVGWKPTKSEYPATLYYLPDIAWPVLLEVEEGIVVPQEEPSRSEK
jgi:hypothetical protein